MTVRTDTGPDRDSVKKMNRMLLPNYQRSSGPVPGKLFYFLVEQPTRSLPEVLALNERPGWGWVLDWFCHSCPLI